MPERKSIRIGMVNFINTAALYEVWKESVDNPAWQVVEATPAELNRMLAAGALDLGFVSSHEYAEQPEKYQILPGLSISATGAVGSVFLFSRLPMAQLDGKRVGLSPQSKTSNGLIKILLEEFYGVRPQYSTLQIDAVECDCEAVLAIGDHALRLKIAGTYPYVLDLGEVWQHRTGLPFVFAVWAVRQEFVATCGHRLPELYSHLIRCAAEGRERLREISQRVAPRIPMAPQECLVYLQGIELDLAPEKVKGLELFYEYLIRRGEVGPHCLPLKLCTAAS